VVAEAVRDVGGVDMLVDRPRFVVTPDPDHSDDVRLLVQ